MERKRDGLVPIREAFGGLDGGGLIPIGDALSGNAYSDRTIFLAAAMAINEEIGRLHGKRPMDQPEVAAIARSVHGYRLRWIEKASYYSPEQKKLWGSMRGIKSGAARRKLTHERDKAIIQAVNEGRSLRAVGMEYGLSAEGVRWIILRGVK